MTPEMKDILDPAHKTGWGHGSRAGHENTPQGNCLGAALGWVRFRVWALQHQPLAETHKGLEVSQDGPLGIGTEGGPGGSQRVCPLNLPQWSGPEWDLEKDPHLVASTLALPPARLEPCTHTIRVPIPYP